MSGDTESGKLTDGAARMGVTSTAAPLAEAGAADLAVGGAGGAGAAEPLGATWGGGAAGVPPREDRDDDRVLWAGASESSERERETADEAPGASASTGPTAADPDARGGARVGAGGAAEEAAAPGRAPSPGTRAPAADGAAGR